VSPQAGVYGFHEGDHGIAPQRAIRHGWQINPVLAFFRVIGAALRVQVCPTRQARLGTPDADGFPAVVADAVGFGSALVPVAVLSGAERGLSGECLS